MMAKSLSCLASRPREGSTIEKEVNGQILQLTKGVTTSRWTYVVDRNGKLVYKDTEVQAATDPETVLKEITTHNSRKSCSNKTRFRTCILPAKII